jgi:bifunctional UDP-N-acetylglucosamine pyrophosphorylase/glucosamine-1-phosphate N-acetyltransferase
MNYQIIILAAGKGTRMGTNALPKVLMPIDGVPMISLLTQEIKKLNFQYKPVIVVGFRYELVQAHLGQDYIYAFQNQQLGTGHAVMSAKDKVQAENVVVLNGDMPFIKVESIQKMIKKHFSSNSVMTMFTTDIKELNALDNPLIHYGRIIRDNGKIAKIVEFLDATEDQRNITEVNPGEYMFNAKWLFKNLNQIRKNNKQSEYYLTDILEIATKQNIEVQSLQINAKEMFGINTNNQLMSAQHNMENLL